jgi:hypothetical protein
VSPSPSSESSPDLIDREVDVLELVRIFRDRYRDDLVSHEVYARTRTTAWLIRGAAGAVTLTGLVVATILTFALGPELGALACVVVGCSSVFAPLLVANRALRRLYVRALARCSVEGGASHVLPFAVPAARFE